jgi:PST family polysaccharide transporter
LNHKSRRFFADHSLHSGLGRQSVRGGAIFVFARAVMALGQIGSVLFLSRLLSPEDYGLVAMVTAITGFAPILVDLGTRDAVVQRERITESEVSTLFWITVIVGCTFGALAAASGPIIARFYNEPRLTTIAVVSALNFVVVALINQHQALMRRALMFRELAAIEVAANLLSACVAIIMAFCGFGYWALVTRSLAMYCFMALGVWGCCAWLPGKPHFTSGVKDMLKFGIHLTGSALVDFGGRNFDRVAIGRALGARILGFYQQALFIYYNLLDVLVFTLNQVAIVSLSKLQSDPNEFRRCWAKALSTLVFYTAAVFGLLAVTSQDIVVLLLGTRWATAGVILSILALRGIPHSIERTSGWLYVSTGRADRNMRWSMFATVGQIIALLCGLPFGTMGVAVAYTLSMVALFIPAIAYAGRPLEIGAGTVVRVVGRQLLGATIAAAVGFSLRAWGLSDAGSLLRVIVIGTAFLSVYFVIVVGIFKMRTPLHVLGWAIRDFLPARPPLVAMASTESPK